MPVPMLPAQLPQDSYRMRILTRMIRAEDHPTVRRKRQPGPLKHGTSTGYRRGCRCEECKACRRVQIAALRATPHAVPKHYHGTENAYTYHSCRCDRCKAAHAACQRAKRNRSRCLCPKSPVTGKRCRRLIPDDARHKYCSEECRIAANIEPRRGSWRKQAAKKRNQPQAAGAEKGKEAR